MNQEKQDQQEQEKQQVTITKCQDGDIENYRVTVNIGNRPVHMGKLSKEKVIDLYDNILKLPIPLELK